MISDTYRTITWHTSIIDNVVATVSFTKDNGNVVVFTFIDLNTSDTHLFDKVVFQENKGAGYADVDGWNTDGEHLISTKIVVQTSTWSEDIVSGTITGSSSNPITLEMASYFMGNNGNVTDTTPPTITTFSPADGTSSVAVGSDIVLTFSEAIQKGSGTIAIHSGSATGAVVESFDAATSNRLRFTGSTVTINPALNLSNNTQYFVTVMSGAVKDLAGNSFSGTSSYDFKTVMGSSVFNTTGSVNGTPQTGERYYSFSAGTGFVAQVLGNNFRFDLSSDTDNNPATFNASWNWLDILGAIGETGTGILTLQDTNTFSPGPENWSASLDFIRNIPLIADGSDADTLPDGFVLLDGMSHVENVSLVWQAKDANNVIASFTSTEKNNQNNDETTSASLFDDNGDNVPDRIVGTSVSVDGSGSFNELLSMIDTNSDGKLDTMQLFMHRTFGGHDIAMSVARQADGKILVGGYITYGDESVPTDQKDWAFALVRYNSDGTLDTSFDGDGKVTANFDPHSEDFGNSVVIQSDGKILFSGRRYDSITGWAVNLLRYTSDGTLDTSFDTDGVVVAPIKGHRGGTSVALQADGKILVTGFTGLDGADADHDVALARYNTNGSLDASFGGTGVVSTNFGGTDDGYTVLVQSNGKIVVAGTSSTSGNGDFVLVRYNADGTLDTSFSGDGIVVTDFGGNDKAYSTALQADGKILLAGESDGNFAVARYNVDGTLDASFDGDGMTTMDLGGLDVARSVAVEGNGKIVVAGETGSGSNYDFAVVRYNSDGSLSSRFGADTGDCTAPAVTSFSPADSVTGVSVGSDIVLSFSEAIKKGTGAIEIHSGSSDGALVAHYELATSSKISIAGNTLTINPTADLDHGTHYFVTFENGTIKDLAGNISAGTNTCDFTTEALPLHQDLTGSATFWKTGAPVTDVTSTLTTAPVVVGGKPVEFRNIQLAPDGTRTLELWETSIKPVESVQLEFTLSSGSVAAWQDAAGLSLGWTAVANTEIAGQFIFGGMGITVLSAGLVKLGTLTLTAPTNPQHFELVLTTGQLNNDTVPTFGIASDSTSTGSYGLYYHINMPDGTYALISAKVSGTAEANAVHPNDALAALKMAVAMNPNSDGGAVSPYQFLAADINKDGVIRAADALNILKMAVKLDTAPANEWLFVPESVGGESMSRTHVIWPDNSIPVAMDVDQELHLIGIVKGDVDGSWVA